MKSLLNRLTLGEKFLILGLLVVALFGTPTWLMVSNINDQIDFASIEVNGSHYMPRVMRVLQTVQQHRGLSAVVLNGKTELRPQWEAKRQEVDQAFAAVDELDRDNQGLGLTNSWQNIKAKWLAVKGELATFSPSASFARHSEVTQDIIEFVHILSDNANITYDPTVEGYQLGFMAVDHLPSLTENMGKLRAMGSTILSQRKASAEERALLGNFVGLARMEEADAKNSLEKIYSANAELRTTIGKVANDAFAAAANVFQLVDEQIVKADEISYSSGDFTNVATAAIDAQFALVVLVAEQLEKSLQSQMNSLTAKKFTLTTIVFSLFAVCVLISWVIARSISKTSRSLAEGLARIAKGDMSVQLADSPGRDELAVMQRATRRMLSEISRIIASVRAATQNITSASEQVSSTAQSLSQASSEQAASVEETSASVEQMSASVKQNAESANVTDGIATKAAKDAVEGGKAVNETVKAMKAIAEQISIIDDIAYQTNLLALNAAIEAARAGEHGKGFAVVASEVRQLAQRSQVAAQEITQVASSSVELAEQAGRLLNEIVPSIQKTSELVQEIAAASEEQSTGVGQVNTAMEQLNQITQTNAAASEELASTAEEMSGQAEQLQKLMRFFKLASKRKKEDEEDDLPIVDEDAEDDVPNDTDIEDDGIQAKDDDVTSDEEDIVDEEEEESVKLVANGNKAVIKGKSKGKTKSKSKSKGSRDESGFVSF